MRKDRGDLEGALKDYNGAIRLKPGDANPYYGRALVLQKKTLSPLLLRIFSNS